MTHLLSSRRLPAALSILAALLLTAPAGAQTAPARLVPGSPVLVAAPPQSTTFDVRLVSPQRMDLGTIVSTETVAAGRLTTTSDIDTPQAGPSRQDTTVVAWPSLEPVSRIEVTPGKTVRATFADGRMTGTATAGGQTTLLDAALDDAFGPGLGRRLARSLPFADGYAATVAQVDGEGTRTVSTLRVTGREQVTRPDGSTADAWVVVLEEPGEPTFTYSVDAATRALLRVSFAPQPGVMIELVAR